MAHRYQISGVLREGGQGIVFRATRVLTPAGAPTQDDVALKLNKNPRDEERVLREIRAMQSVRHECLADLIEYGYVEIHGQRYLYTVWQFIPGKTVDTMLNGGSLAPQLVAIIGRDVASALHHIWTSQKIVHRDVSPKNIIVRLGFEQAVLLDLGAARHLQERTITAPGMTWGTIGYMSPEQCRTETALTCASDVFSLGVVLFECILGSHPTSLDQSVLVVSPPDVVSLAPAAPAVLANLIDRMLRPRAAFRPTPAEITNLLTQAVGVL